MVWNKCQFWDGLAAVVAVISFLSSLYQQKVTAEVTDIFLLFLCPTTVAEVADFM